jgi:pimeloyl-ACP methyl ester carboxylesterase
VSAAPRGRALADRRAAPLPGEGGAVIDTDGGPTFVRSVGAGPPVVVLHGGPGFDHSYLYEPLAGLARRHRLVFYDQTGSGRSPAPAGGATLGAMITQARAVLRLVAEAGQGQIGVIAHSWGALVLVAAYAGTTGVPAAPVSGARTNLPILAEGALVNPVAVTRGEWDVAFRNLLSRASPQQVADFQRLLGEGDGPGAMAVALPIYTRAGYARPIVGFPLNAATYIGVTAQLGDFDYRAGAAALDRLTLINGRDDFTGPELIEPLTRRARTVLRPPVGHFPFFEAPAEFSALIARVFP